MHNNHKMNQSCTTQVTTPSGRFTFHEQRMSICEAKKFCAEKNEILAPITNEEDSLAIARTIHEGDHEGCWFHNFQRFFIGLDVTPCGKGKQERVFTNGEVWNPKVHDKFYVELGDTWNKPCVFALFDIDEPFVASWKGCYEKTTRFICLKPTDPTKVDPRSESCGSSSSALVVNETNQSLINVGFVGFLALAAVFLALISTRYYRKYRNIEEKLTEEELNLSFSKQ